VRSGRLRGSHTPPAIILGGGLIALAVARSLAREGVRIYALGDGAWDTIRHSRYCAAFFDVGSGIGVQERYLAWLESGPRDSVVLPCSDDALEVVARHRLHLLELGYITVEANDDVLLAMLDKHRTYALAQDAGIPAPRHLVVREKDDLAAVGLQIGFPCILKPRHSHFFAGHFGLRQKVFIVRNERELASRFAVLAGLGLDVIASEIVPGSDDRYAGYFTYLDEEGEPLFHFTKRKLRQFPPYFGLGCYHVSDWSEEVAAQGLAFCRRVGVRGLANVEFKRDAVDGRLKLIECNQRFTLTTPLLSSAGIDLPAAVYGRLIGQDDFRAGEYRTGVHLWFPVEDLRAFWRYRREGDLRLSQWTRSLLHRPHFPAFSWRDPRPSLAEYYQPARLIAKRKLAGARTRLAGAVGTARKRRQARERTTPSL
jgi:D-aspartate ligase